MLGDNSSGLLLLNSTALKKKNKYKRSYAPSGIDRNDGKLRLMKVRYSVIFLMLKLALRGFFVSLLI